MIRRFEWIKDSGIFSDYRWDSTLPPLGRINLIYGPNGSGKTSLAGVLYGLQRAVDSEGFKRISLTLDDKGTTRTTNGLDDLMFDRVCVFSEHYVARNHWFTPAEAEMEAVLTIGKKPVETELKLKELYKTIEDKTAQRDNARSTERVANQAIDKVYSRVSQQVVDAASKAGGRWHSRSNFNARMVRSAFNQSHTTWLALSEIELSKKIGIINSSKSDSLSEDELIVQAPKSITGRLSTALASSPSTIILDTLATHPNATPWVDKGRPLHSGLGTCIFCGSPLTAGRKMLIDQHFSNEVERLQTDLRCIIRDLTLVETSVETTVTRIPSRGLFFDDLKIRYDDAKKALIDELTALQIWALDCRAQAESKAANVLAVTESIIDEPPLVVGTDLISLRSEHNDRVAKHESLVHNAANSVELHYLKRAEPEVETNQSAVTLAHALIERLNIEIADHQAKVTSLETVDGDPIPSAKVLTKEVARLLGRDELKFEAIRGKYYVTRGGQPALGLSVGERTAITLVHFLESVARFDSSKGKPIVVIDDPVSSLDSNIFMGISTYIWGESIAKEHIAQVILLTHDFELFRQWDVQIQGLPGSGGAQSKYPSSLYEIRSTHVNVDGKLKRRPQLVGWPSTLAVRKKMRSTYQHSFMMVAQTLQTLQSDDSMEHKLDAQLLFPNVIRRMLESFLAFKHPEWVGNFSEAMRKSKDLLVTSGYKGDADALRLRLTRYSHAHSHSETPSTDITVSPDEVATAISAVFEFMNCLDPVHFRGLCKVIEVQPSDILTYPESVSDQTETVIKEV